MSPSLVSLLTVLAGAASVAASPLATRDGNSTSGRQQCVMPHAGNGQDDTPGIVSAIQNCTTDASIIFSQGVDYQILTPLVMRGLKNVDIQVQGNLHLPNNITAVQKIINGTNYFEGNGFWFTIQGQGIDYVGTSNVTGGWIESYGEQWWDLNLQNGHGNGTGLPGRPHVLSFNVTDATLKYYKSRKPIAWNVQLTGKNITVEKPYIDATNRPGGGFPFNTDGFDVGATDVEIKDFTILNGDDGFAIQTGAHNVYIHDGLLDGPGCHGMSIGSLGQNQALFANVSDIVFDGVNIANAVYGARFKSWVGGQGLAKNVTWKNMKVSNVTYPIFVTQTYINQGSTQTQLQNGSVTGRPNNASVIMQNFLWENWTGTINSFQPGDGSCATNPCWYNNGLANVDGTQAIVMECTNSTTCNDFVTRNIDIVPQKANTPTSVICMNIGDSSPQLGFTCANGTYAPYPN